MQKKTIAPSFVEIIEVVISRQPNITIQQLVREVERMVAEVNALEGTEVVDNSLVLPGVSSKPSNPTASHYPSLPASRRDSNTLVLECIKSELYLSVSGASRFLNS